MMNDEIFKFEQKGIKTITIKNVESGQSILELPLKIILIFTTIVIVFMRAVPALFMSRWGLLLTFFF
jgi:hypothetical protein